jgi:homoserine O-acetyltransferase
VKNSTIRFDFPFILESGIELPFLEINYTCSESININHKKVIWICHALTANSDPSMWWPELVGDDKFYNTKDYFIICANVLGSCYGSSGPATKNLNGELYCNDFPQITIRDMVKAHELLRKHLQIELIHTCIGGSVGGQQALEWSIMNPSLIQNLILLCTNAFHSAWGIAFNEAQRMAIQADDSFGDKNLVAGAKGLRAARAMALLSYRNYNTYNNTQKETDLNKLDAYAAASYQQYQGKKLEQRFNAYSYWILSKAMDSHQVARNRGSVENALSIVLAKTLIIGISSDLLFPIAEQKFLAKHIRNSIFLEIDSDYGHDGFLLEYEKIKNAIMQFYQH